MENCIMRTKLNFIRLIVAICLCLTCIKVVYAGIDNATIAPILQLLLGEDDDLEDIKTPTLSLLVATDTDSLVIAWIPGSGVRPNGRDVDYNIHLSVDENFIPDSSNLNKTVNGVSQTEITGLASGTLYFSRVIAVSPNSISNPSNKLQTKTFGASVELDSSVTFENAKDLGLGNHTTANGTTYSYAGGSLPTVGGKLFSTDDNGGMTLRTIISASGTGPITVETSDASLTDIVNRGFTYNAFKLSNVSSDVGALKANNLSTASFKQEVLPDNSEYSRIDWADNLLSAEQINYAYNKPGLVVEPQGPSSAMKISNKNAVEDSFIATVTTDFEPELITKAEWGGLLIKELETAKVAAKGNLSITANAHYNFTASGSVSSSFQLSKRTWTSLYPIAATGLFVYQEISLSLDVETSASAQAELNAMASANLTETIEVGATYDGSTWVPYIIHDESESLTASLSIVGGANAEIRIIPKIEVKFYTALSASLTIEPLAESSLNFERTTNSVDFLVANPERLLQVTSFDASLGLESNIAANLTVLGKSWDFLPSTCVLGTGSCINRFDPYQIFSIPSMNLSSNDCTAKLEITDGINNPFSSDTIKWEIFPDDGTLTAGSCSKFLDKTTCNAEFIPGTHDDYLIFASGYGRLGEVGRQFKEFNQSSACSTEIELTANSISNTGERGGDHQCYGGPFNIYYLNFNYVDNDNNIINDLSNLRFEYDFEVNGCLSAWSPENANGFFQGYPITFTDSDVSVPYGISLGDDNSDWADISAFFIDLATEEKISNDVVFRVERNLNYP